ncbi:retrotransposon gag family protein, partial [Mycobacterium kansasii]
MGYVWTWTAFEFRFHEKYYPQTYRHEREDEFLRLRQGGMSVTEYEHRFTELGRFVPTMVVDEKMRMRRFSLGLR